MQEALNDQINAEFYSAYLYLSMEACFQSMNLPGCANWMRVQTQEELTHAMKIYDFVNERGGRVTLKSIQQPPTKWDSPLTRRQGHTEVNSTAAHQVGFAFNRLRSRLQTRAESDRID
jgi:ferritin